MLYPNNQKVSVIIRAKNEMPWVKYTLKMLRIQTIQNIEILCVDSGSTDGTWETLNNAKPDIIYQIEPNSYIPGKVLNDAIKKTSGNIIVFNNADCIPQNKEWLQKLIQPLTLENDIVATFANQIARNNAIPLVQKDYQRAFGDGTIHQKWRHFFSLASSAVRRNIIVNHPFNENLQYSEDIEWSWRIKKMGKIISYIPDAIVEHSHNYTLKQIVKRFYGEGNADKDIYNEEYKTDCKFSKDLSFFRSVVLATSVETFRDWVWLIKKGNLLWMAKSPLYRFLQRYSAYRGRKAHK